MKQIFDLFFHYQYVTDANWQTHKPPFSIAWKVYIGVLVLLHANRSGRKFYKSVSEPLKKQSSKKYMNIALFIQHKNSIQRKVKNGLSDRSGQILFSAQSSSKQKVFLSNIRNVKVEKSLEDNPRFSSSCAHRFRAYL